MQLTHMINSDFLIYAPHCYINRIYNNLYYIQYVLKINRIKIWLSGSFISFENN